MLTSIARLPSVLTSTIGGNAIGTQKYGFAIIVFAATAILSGAGLLIYRSIQKKRALAEAGRALASQPLTEYAESSIDDDRSAPDEESMPGS